MKIGDYVRIENGDIGKIIKIYDHEKVGKMIEIEDCYFRFKEKEIIKSSPNIIDVIEKGDYVNGYKVSFKDTDFEPFVQCDYTVQNGTTNHYRFSEKAIEFKEVKKYYNSING